MYWYKNLISELPRCVSKPFLSTNVVVVLVHHFNREAKPKLKYNWNCLLCEALGVTVIPLMYNISVPVKSIEMCFGEKWYNCSHAFITYPLNTFDIVWTGYNHPCQISHHIHVCLGTMRNGRLETPFIEYFKRTWVKMLRTLCHTSCRQYRPA